MAIKIGENVTEISTVPQRHDSHPDGDSSDEILYKLEDVPPWKLSIVLGLQHYLTMMSGAVTVPYMLASHLCISEQDGGVSESLIISTTFFVAGLSTLLQSIVGNRLPIIQGPSLSFLVPTLAILSQPKFTCPDPALMFNATKEESDEVWMSRMREVQGAIIVASMVEVLVGLTGVIGLLMRWITPLAIAPTITLIGLDLFTEAAEKASGHWGIAAMTMALMVAFSQYLSNVGIPIFTFTKEKGCHTKSFRFFKVFPVMLAIILSWGLCAILTHTDVFEADSKARTDLGMKALEDTVWFRFPYPGQWGMPTFGVGPILGVFAGVMASTIESIGDYYACARLAGAPPPPVHAINRGICLEGIGCVLAGVFGTGCGLTSFSQNVGAIGITKVGSRRVIQFAGIIIILFGLLGKFGALFAAIPSPVMGGIFCVTFGIVTGVGLSNLQFVNLNCTRNLFIIGFSLFMGLAIPKWLAAHPSAIETGSDMGNQIVTILLRTSMFVGGFFGCFLDNTIPGSEHDRGTTKWRAQTIVDVKDEGQVDCYNFPCGMSIIKKINFFRFIPICPTYDPESITLPCRKSRRKSTLPMTYFETSQM